MFEEDGPEVQSKPQVQQPGQSKKQDDQDDLQQDHLGQDQADHLQETGGGGGDDDGGGGGGGDDSSDEDDMVQYDKIDDKELNLFAGHWFTQDETHKSESEAIADAGGDKLEDGYKSLRVVTFRTVAAMDAHHTKMDEYAQNAAMSTAAADAKAGMKDAPSTAAETATEAKKRADDIASWNVQISEWADEGQSLQLQVNADEAGAKKAATEAKSKPRDTTVLGSLQESKNKAVAHKTNVQALLDKRRTAKGYRMLSKQSKNWYKAKKLGWGQSFGAWIIEKAKAFLAEKLKDEAVKAATGGLAGYDAEKKEFRFAAWQDFKKARGAADKVRQSGAMGNEGASHVYMWLKLTANEVLPKLRTFIGYLGLWALGISVLTAGATLPVAALCAAAVLVITIVKAALDLALVIWSAIQSSQTSGRDARQNKLAKNELMENGKNLALDVLDVGVQGMVSHDVDTGVTKGPGETMEARFDLDKSGDMAKGFAVQEGENRFANKLSAGGTGALAGGAKAGSDAIVGTSGENEQAENKKSERVKADKQLKDVNSKGRTGEKELGKLINKATDAANKTTDPKVVKQVDELEGVKVATKGVLTTEPT